MQAAIDQNTKGVILLTSGYHHAAAKCFKQALSSLRTACDSLSPSATEKLGMAAPRTAFHYYAYITDAKPEQCLQKAGMLYSHCLQLMSVLPDTYEDEKLQISSASLSHLADVCFTLGDANGVRSALDGLLMLNLRNYLVNQDPGEHQSIAPAA
ncbi:expressed unknown protein [Seminavis robusta]|uniref:Uncharacterized protein n=1 Tax=Seminavis robusta TaxID=568900 RepID=A0A9N8H9A6_9STRA|nr:expressed unknown protein [Seminavis robusta]CAB9530481.1 expressed unknown protein [Seminavis robusta]|eukprot:Sro185_g080170.1 n/a (154) ;mRNA; r:979-1572